MLGCEFVRRTPIGTCYAGTFLVDCCRLLVPVSANWCTGAAGGSIQGVKLKIGIGEQ